MIVWRPPPPNSHFYNVSPRSDQVCLSACSPNNKHSVCTVCFSPSLFQKCTQRQFNLQTAHILPGTHHIFLCMLLIFMLDVCVDVILCVCVSFWLSLHREMLPVSLHVCLRVDPEKYWGLVNYASVFLVEYLLFDVWLNCWNHWNCNWGNTRTAMGSLYGLLTHWDHSSNGVSFIHV